jgi:hypothetical protein
MGTAPGTDRVITPSHRWAKSRFRRSNKGNQIFVDGGFAGRTGELKKFPLRTGMHTIEFRDAKGQSYYKEQINVIAGKKLKIQA